MNSTIWNFSFLNSADPDEAKQALVILPSFCLDSSCSDMASEKNQQLHFILIPHLAQGHMIPMIDMAKLLALRGVTVTVITTPSNAARFQTSINRAIESGLPIQLLEVPFPALEAGLPQGCENMDSLPSRHLIKNLLIGVNMLREPVETLLHELHPAPSCIISDKYFIWSRQTADKFRIPLLMFDGTSCFTLLCTHNILVSGVHESLSDSEPFVVPGLPDRIVLTKAQLPNSVIMKDAQDIRIKMRETEEAAYGEIINSFEELEPGYVDEFRKVRGGKLWCIGPVSLCNEGKLDKVDRGNKAAIGESHCLKWLDLWAPGSVVYVCLGSLSRITVPQLIELGLGLEAANRPFIWVIKGENKSEEFEKWLSENSEARFKGRGLLIRGWAPQVLILSHSAVGGYLMHCGWNSTLEGICAGLPMITWPSFAEQFYNERFIVQVFKVGVRLGAEFSVKWAEKDNPEMLVNREEVKRAVDQLMDGGTEAEERRQRARKLGEMANRAMQEGGSSYLNLTLLIEDIKQQVSISR